MAKTLSEAKENIWMDIRQLVIEIWPLIQIMFEQHDLVQRAKHAINGIKGELGEMPTKDKEIIKFLNSKSKEEMEALQSLDQEGVNATTQGESSDNGCCDT